MSKDKRHAERSTLAFNPDQSAPPSHEQIERLAYMIWESRHGAGPGPDEDWLEAERRLRGEGLAGARRDQESRTTATVN